MLYGPYSAKISGGRKTIDYLGNKAFETQADISTKHFTEGILKERLDALVHDERFFHIHKIDSGIFDATITFFKSIGGEWCNLPLTTMMISSPGGVYAGKTIDYTTDALPVDISWFDNARHAYLAESSQFYLELRLLIPQIERVFSIYNSFRKESADIMHLSEFQHIEFEGKVNFEKNVEIFLGLLKAITKHLVSNHFKSLSFFLTEQEIKSLDLSFDDSNIERLTLRNALDVLYTDTHDDRYKEFTLRYFGAWEEIRITELMGRHVLLTEYPLMQIPMYHNQLKIDQGTPVAENADLILYRYREAIGSGTRIRDRKTLAEKALIFNLPTDDYEPYLRTRDYAHYTRTSGFGLGWQRYMHWLLKLPVIWEATHVPRGQYLPRP